MQSQGMADEVSLKGHSFTTAGKKATPAADARFTPQQEAYPHTECFQYN
jgi:hypothetical protein